MVLGFLFLVESVKNVPNISLELKLTEQKYCTNFLIYQLTNNTKQTKYICHHLSKNYNPGVIKNIHIYIAIIRNLIFKNLIY